MIQNLKMWLAIPPQKQRAFASQNSIHKSKSIENFPHIMFYSLVRRNSLLRWCEYSLDFLVSALTDSICIWVLLIYSFWATWQYILSCRCCQGKYVSLLPANVDYVFDYCDMAVLNHSTIYIDRCTVTVLTTTILLMYVHR